MHNIKNTISKSKEKVENIKEINKLNKIINKSQNDKIKIFINAGMYLYEKVRKDEIVERDLIELFNDMPEIDKAIYEASIELNGIDLKKEKVCECGNLIDVDSNFCCKCGKRIEEDKEVKKCEYCLSDIDCDSNFCVCCGKKL
jgi:hypothetical protein